MNSAKLLLPLLALALAAAPLAHAQPIPFQGIGLTATPPANPIAYMGGVNVPVQFKVGCSTLLQHAAGTASAMPGLEVHADETPTGLTVKETTFPLDPSSCIAGSGEVSGSGTVNFTVDATSPGVIDQNVTLQAHFSDDESDAGEFLVPFTVAYHADYTVVPDVTFPLKVTNGQVTFHLAVTQNSNARSMVMMEDKHETTGVLSGLASIPYESHTSKTFNITYKAPSTAWTNATVTFSTYSHFLLLDQRAGTYQMPQHLMWTFTNGGGAGPGAASSSEAKKSPDLGLAFVGVALVGAVLVARRRAA